MFFKTLTVGVEAQTLSGINTPSYLSGKGLQGIAVL